MAKRTLRPKHLRWKSIGKCECCGRRMMAGDYPPDCPKPRLKGVCWGCMEVIDKHPAQGKRR